MNHQGGMDNLNSDGHIQNEGSIGASGLLSSSSSPTGSSQSLPDRPSGSNSRSYHDSANLVPSHDCNAGVFPRNIDLNTEYVGMEEQGVDGSSVDMSRKRRTPEHAIRELSIGESSGTAIESATPKRRASPSQVIANTSLNISSPFTDPANGHPEQFEAAIGHGTMRQVSDMAYSSEARRADNFQRNIRQQNNFNQSAPYTCPLHNYPEQFEAGIGHGTTRPVSYMQHLSEGGQTENFQGSIHLQNRANTSTLHSGHANNHPEQFEAGIGHGTVRPLSNMLHWSGPGQVESFQSNIYHQTSANPQAFLPPSILSTGYTRNPCVQLPVRSPFFYQCHYHPFFCSGVTPFGVTASTQFVHFPHFHQTLQASRWNNFMRPSVPLPSSFSNVYTGTGGETMAPFRMSRNISRNIMLGPQTGRLNWVHNAANLSFANGTANFLRNFARPSQYGSISSNHLSNAPTWVPRFNLSQQYVPISSGVANHSVAASMGFPWQSSQNRIDSDPSAVSREMDSSIAFNAQHRYYSEAISEDQVDDNPELRFISQYPARFRNRLMNEIRSALEHLRNGGSLRLEELMILDYSHILYLLEHNNHEDMPLDVENMSYEELLALEEEIGNVNVGLSEEDIMMHLRHETFQSITEGTPGNGESCCICQEDYVDGDELGKLDCGHKYHVVCIKQWLVLKNNCPVCKQTALAFPDPDL